jgi:hydroxymethylbilane synthase
MAEGLAIAGYLPREDPRDMLSCAPGSARRGRSPPAARAGACRRGSCFRAPSSRDPGNVDTRLKKIADLGLADATVLAAAGLKRLGIGSWPGLEFHAIGFESMVPAVGQGAIAIQCRAATRPALRAYSTGRRRARSGWSGPSRRRWAAGATRRFGAYATRDTLYFFPRGRRPADDALLGRGDFARPAPRPRGSCGELGLK